MSVDLGAVCLGENRCRFRVWAPRAQRVEAHILSPGDKTIPLAPADGGYHQAEAEDVPPGTLYRYRLDARLERPDPASHLQPQGVHGPSQVVDLATFPWSDASWAGVPLDRYVIYELHVGAFTPAGTFDAILPRLPELKDLGITALELMPVAQFPGTRNWGYDGVFPYAVQNSYGGPDGLRRLVDAGHRHGLAVILDVVYNHLGPEGNYLGDFGPYFTDRYHTPWGPALNLDGAGSDEVRYFFIQNALHWVTDFHVDALRLDAIHGICDFSARPFLAELAEVVHRRAAELGRRVYLIPESDLNDARVVRLEELGGYGLDAQWSDDFHHALHALLTGERNGYYCDFGSLSQLAKAFREGFVYSGQYSAYRRRRHGNSSACLPAHQFVVCAQNHDQVGNRMLGERLSRLVSFEALKLAAGAVLLSPYLPLLFMGEEYGETTPFQYFVSHSDPGLIKTVRRGRRQEFEAFAWKGTPPDPQDEATFQNSKLDCTRAEEGNHRALRELMRELLQLRGVHPALARPTKDNLRVTEMEKNNLLLVARGTASEQVVTLLHFSDAPRTIAIALPEGRWRKLVDSAEPRWGGPGSAIPPAVDCETSVTLTLSPWSFALFGRSTPE